MKKFTMSNYLIFLKFRKHTGLKIKFAAHPKTDKKN